MDDIEVMLAEQTHQDPQRREVLPKRDRPNDLNGMQRRHQAQPAQKPGIRRVCDHRYIVVFSCGGDMILEEG